VGWLGVRSVDVEVEVEGDTEKNVAFSDNVAAAADGGAAELKPLPEG
jgi:hypothetical protein